MRRVSGSSPLLSTIRDQVKRLGLFLFVFIHLCQAEKSACSGSGQRFESVIVHHGGPSRMTWSFSFAFSPFQQAEKSACSGSAQRFESVIVHHKRPSRKAWSFSFARGAEDVAPLRILSNLRRDRRDDHRSSAAGQCPSLQILSNLDKSRRGGRPRPPVFKPIAFSPICRYNDSKGGDGDGF